MEWLQNVERGLGAQLMDRNRVVVPTSEASRVSKGTMVGNVEGRTAG